MPYNPLDKVNLGKSVLDALLEGEAHPLADVGSIQGAGIYAIYYAGPFEPYQSLSETNRDRPQVPIYVGKAIPKGGRKGLTALDAATGRALGIRLSQHADSIRAAENLEIGDFWCGQLVVDDIWIPLGESLTIQQFRPLWNQVVEGFGNKTPGAKRFSGERPLWDEFHPGRPWAVQCAPAKLSATQIANQVKAFFEENSPEGIAECTRSLWCPYLCSTSERFTLCCLG